MNDTARLQAIQERLRAANDRHRQRFAAAVTELARNLSREYAFQVELILSGPGWEALAGGPEEDGRADLKRYLLEMQWVIWGDCELGPPLGLSCHPDEIALGVLAYLGARLLDDAIDGHRDYKGRIRTFYGTLRNHREPEVAAATGAVAGSLVIEAALEQLQRRGYTDSAHRLRSLYARVFAGALAETLAAPAAISPAVYNAIVAHKAVAYDRLLHQVFFRTGTEPLRSRILHLLARHSEVSQWLNDLLDEAEDRRRGQPNFLIAHRLSQAQAQDQIVAAIAAIHDQGRSLPEPLRDAMAGRLLDSLRKMAERDPHGT